MVDPNQSSLLTPLPTFGSKREASLESGYLSHEGSNSTPNSPKSLKRRVKLGAIGQSISEDGDGSESRSPPARIMPDAREMRKQFQA